VSEQPDPEQPRPSGLRNPSAAVRGVGAAALGTEGLVLLLAIVPLRVLAGSDASGGTPGTVVIIVLAAASFILAGLLGRRWGWLAGSVLQVVVIVSGFFVHTALVVLGVLFGLVWLYVLYVRRSVLGRS
jgi:hypothetical protein